MECIQGRRFQYHVQILFTLYVARYVSREAVIISAEIYWVLARSNHFASLTSRSFVSCNDAENIECLSLDRGVEKSCPWLLLCSGYSGDCEGLITYNKLSD